MSIHIGIFSHFLVFFLLLFHFFHALPRSAHQRPFPDLCMSMNVYEYVYTYVSIC